MTRHEPSTSDRIGSPVGSPVPRRAPGQGTIKWRPDRGRWDAIIRLRDGRQAKRAVWQLEQAEVVITQLIAEHQDELGYHYVVPPRPFRHGESPKRARKGMSQRLRFAVLTRDGFKCRYCGAPAPDVRLTVDHVIPVAKGGTDDMDNLVAACEDCNGGKADLTLGAAE